jgi:hypothetical protein
MKAEIQKQHQGGISQCRCGRNVTGKPWILVADGSPVCVLCADRAGLDAEFIECMHRNEAYTMGRRDYASEIQRAQQMPVAPVEGIEKQRFNNLGRQGQ